LQALSYTLAMYIGLPVLFLTGLGLMLPVIGPDRIFGIGGMLLTDLIHIIAGVVMTLFLMLHIYMSTFGKTPFSSFRAIITGWQEGD
jgi:thiosulfate reductase cytochrome b subunit